MSRHIMKLHDEKEGVDYYLEWSTVVDAPVTYGMSLEDFKAYYEKLYGQQGMQELPGRLERVEQYGISAFPPFHEMREYLGHNRAGESESCLDKEGLLDRYCRQ